MSPLTHKCRHRLAITFITASILFCHAQAGMIGTETINSTHLAEANKQYVHTALLRDDVKQALLAHGVNPQHVQQRIDQLTDQEIQQLANQFDQLPAASGVGLVLFATGPIVFMLELMGFTDLTTTF
ncbi:MAG: PA2779 family protein [Gammaproteobacteria bacterium]|nr:PA2779 family protein [Gammaproteobacteria bacterium]